MSKRSRQRQRHLHNANNGDGLESKIPLPAPLVDAPVIEMERAAVAAVGEIVERANGNESRQPRFSAKDPSRIWTSVYQWTKLPALHDEPKSTASIREWDVWLREFYPLEPYLTGVMNSIVQIDKNRHWSITGGRNQVKRYTDILRAADNGAGWRAYVAWQAQSYYLSRLGFITELGREGEGGPLRALWSVDPCACEVTGSIEYPLKYYPVVGDRYAVKAQPWAASDFFRAASLVSTDERKMGTGLPWLARCYQLALIMVAVWEHDKEQLAARAPRGLLLLMGISEEQWNDAMQARTEKLDSLEREYFGGVATLASAGAEEINAKLVALSQLPANFDLQKWVALLMYGYALGAGYDAREFFPVDSGDLGSEKETEVQHRKASSKGDLDFSLAHQEQIQNQLPPTLLFEYEQRDAAGELADTVIDDAKAKVIETVTKWVIDGRSVLSADQILQLAAQKGVIPQEWTPEEETVSASDTDSVEVERLAENAVIRRAIERFPDEPLVRYEYPSGKERVLVMRGGDLLRRRLHPAPTIEQITIDWRDNVPDDHDDIQVLRTLGFDVRDAIMRSVADVVGEYERELSRFVQETFDGDLNALDLARAHRALIRTLGPRAFDEGLKAGGVDPSEKDSTDEETLAEWQSEQLAHVRDFATAAVSAEDETQRAAIRARVETWAQSVRAAGDLGRLSAQKNAMLTFDGQDGKVAPCPDCKRMKNQRHRASWWLKYRLVPKPGNENYECGNWENCQHFLRDDNGNRFTGE